MFKLKIVVSILIFFTTISCINNKEDACYKNSDCRDKFVCINGLCLKSNEKECNNNEVCNGIDDNCNGVIDEENTADCSIYFLDKDKDGYGLDTDKKCLCAPIDNYSVLTGTDCNDNNTNIYPGAEELCNNIDDDCDNLLDHEEQLKTQVSQTLLKKLETDRLNCEAIRRILFRNLSPILSTDFITIPIDFEKFSHA